MKLILSIAITFWAISSFGQSVVLQANQTNCSENDTIPKVSYSRTEESSRAAVHYINEKMVDETRIKTINPKLIDNIDVLKKDVEIDGKKYWGQIYIRMKEAYRPKLISLTNLKQKYTKVDSSPCIFMIDDTVINGDPNTQMVDEGFILQIVVEKVVNPKENLKVNLIKLATKTDENIKKANNIHIRGNNSIMLGE